MSGLPQEEPVPDPRTSPDGPERAESTDDVAEDIVAGREPGTAVLRGQGAAVGAVALGGAVGALARWVFEALFPAPPGGFPITTFAINVGGCLLMGALVVLVAEARQAHPIVRPFLGVGVLGGFTTFSSYAVEARQLLDRGHLGTGALYLVATVVAALLAVLVGLTVTRRLAGVR